jgi:hypothetical protein
MAGWREACAGSVRQAARYRTADRLAKHLLGAMKELL